VAFEPTIPASERAKTVYALDRTAAVTGQLIRISESLVYLETIPKTCIVCLFSVWNVFEDPSSVTLAVTS
jgi:hypothetical protein